MSAELGPIPILLEIGRTMARIVSRGELLAFEEFDHGERIPASIRHDAWLLSHQWSRLSGLAPSDFSSASAEMDTIQERLGRRLVRHYLPGTLRQVLSRLVAHAEVSENGARIGLRLVEPDRWDLDLNAASLPWEAIVLVAGDAPIGLVTGIEFVRFTGSDEEDLRLPEVAHIGPVLLQASFPRPADSRSAPLDHLREGQAIQEAVTRRGAGLRVDFTEIESRAETLLHIYGGGYAHILHLSTHGDLDQIEVESGTGYQRFLDSESLAEAVRAATQPTPVYFLSSCFSGGTSATSNASLAERLVDAGGCVALGMRLAVSDSFALALAETFYELIVQREQVSVVSAMCAARAHTAAGMQEGRRLGFPVVVVEWASVVVYVREDVLFADDHAVRDSRGSALWAQRVDEKAGSGAGSDLVVRSPIRYQLRWGILHTDNVDRLVYGPAGVGKSREVREALSTCGEVVLHLASVSGTVTQQEFRQALVEGLMHPQRRVSDVYARRASEVAERAVDTGTPLTLVFAHLENLLATADAEARFVLVWDQFEHNLARRRTSDGSPIDPAFVVMEPWLEEAISANSAPDQRVRTVVVSRHMFAGHDGARMPRLSAFNIGLFTRRQSDELVDRLTSGDADEALKLYLWHELGGHPAGIRLALESLAQAPRATAEQVLAEVNDRLSDTAEVPTTVASLSPFASDLLVHVAVLRHPVPTGAMAWLMSAVGPVRGEESAARVDKMLQIVEDPAATSTSGRPYVDWEPYIADGEFVREELISELETEPWLRLSIEGRVAAIHELLSNGLLTVDSNVNAEHELFAVAPRYVARYLARTRPADTKQAHITATFYWLGPAGSEDWDSELDRLRNTSN